MVGPGLMWPCLTVLPWSSNLVQGGAEGLTEVIVEPFVDAMEVSVAVLETASGPVALLPTEVELFDIDDVLVDADLDLQHHVDRNEVRVPSPSTAVALAAPWFCTPENLVSCKIP